MAVAIFHREENSLSSCRYRPLVAVSPPSLSRRCPILYRVYPLFFCSHVPLGSCAVVSALSSSKCRALRAPKKSRKISLFFLFLSLVVVLSMSISLMRSVAYQKNPEKVVISFLPLYPPPQNECVVRAFCFLFSFFFSFC